MMKILTTILLIFFIGNINAQFIKQNLGGSAKTNLYAQGAFSANKGIVQTVYADTTTANIDTNVIKTDGIQIKVGVNVYTRDVATHSWVLPAGGGSGGVVPGGPITTIPSLGINPGVNLTGPNWIISAFYGTQLPTASLSGGQNLELTSTPTTVFTLSWAAGRQSNTNPLSTVVVGGVNQTFSQPAVNNSVSGTQNVTVTTNTTTTYSNIVTTTDSKSQTATTVFNYYPKRYWFYSSNAAPTSSDVIASLGGSNELTTTRVKNSAFSVTVTGTNKYVTYAYPLSYGALTSINISGLESIGAFNQTTVSVTNASGFVQNYLLFTTQNTFNNTSINFILVQ